MAVRVSAVVFLLVALPVLLDPRACTRCPSYPPESIVRTQLEEFTTCVEAFRRKHGRLPETLAELAAQSGGEEYVYLPLPDGDGRPFRLSSMGPDRLAGTGDDVDLRRRR